MIGTFITRKRTRNSKMGNFEVVIETEDGTCFFETSPNCSVVYDIGNWKNGDKIEFELSRYGHITHGKVIEKAMSGRIEKSYLYTSGTVFFVVARFQEDREAIRVSLASNEGFGDPEVIWIDPVDGLSIPETIELYFMDYECMPTWFWSERSLFANGVPPFEYWGEFAHVRNYKTQGNFTAEGTHKADRVYSRRLKRYEKREVLGGEFFKNNL